MQRLLFALLGFRPSEVATMFFAIGQLLLMTALAFAFAERSYPCFALRFAFFAQLLAALIAFAPLVVEAGRKLKED